jgi:hypothetical protein
MSCEKCEKSVHGRSVVHRTLWASKTCGAVCCTSGYQLVPMDKHCFQHHTRQHKNIGNAIYNQHNAGTAALAVMTVVAAETLVTTRLQQPAPQHVTGTPRQQPLLLGAAKAAPKVYSPMDRAAASSEIYEANVQPGQCTAGLQRMRMHPMQCSRPLACTLD